MTSNKEIVLGGTVITSDIQVEEVVSIDDKHEENAIFNPDEINEKLKSASEINEKLEAFLRQQKISDTDDSEEDLEEGDIDINNMLNDLDFVIVLKTKEPDVHFIVPQISDFENMSDDLKTNISQNHFLLGFINFALNNESWIEEYSSHVVNLANKDFEDNLNNLGVLSDLKNLFNGMSEMVNQNNENLGIEEKDLTDKLIDFQEAVEKMKNKPKIIT